MTTTTTDLPDLDRPGRDARVTVTGDSVRITIHTGTKHIAIDVDRHQLAALLDAA